MYRDDSVESLRALADTLAHDLDLVKARMQSLAGDMGTPVAEHHPDAPVDNPTVGMAIAWLVLCGLAVLFAIVAGS